MRQAGARSVSMAAQGQAGLLGLIDGLSNPQMTTIKQA
jgi:hypothetical protein